MEEINTNANNTQNTNRSSDFLAIAIILGLVLAGGIYAFFKAQEFANPLPSSVRLMSPKRFAPANNMANDPVLSAPESSSTDPVDIEKDLDMTDLDTIDKDLQGLDNI